MYIYFLMWSNSKNDSGLGNVNRILKFIIGSCNFPVCLLPAPFRLFVGCLVDLMVGKLVDWFDWLVG